ncbi:aa3-type cytochrome c oxidase subunit IV [Asticcacaulis machinosus]|uniref:Aa3-type cytochrome c oxidase subunit IV n=1 Tax=Asticcacaulis machinosus TaxID=2984211 RepID=A0ABT5HMB0_9CAUL|nr:aa3-type cytochrome c oxidase subunit IV [Asticcacaulis machinosus]MDC7677386.1 aa3-type cytochrome c oxidase subunit IV [Asticcacaulis machinosus]
MAGSHDSHNDSHNDYVKGEMDIHDQQNSYNLFMGMTKWGSLGTAAFVLFITVMFAVKGAGFIPAAISTGALLVIGWFMLKTKPDAKH